MRTSSKFSTLGQHPIFSVFFTAGYPRRDDTGQILNVLSDLKVGMVEIGFPFSDPIADGPTIQKSSQIAIDNGMTLRLLLEQLSEVRSGIHMPVLLMGYLNPILQFGVERFFSEVSQAGVDGLIIPDLPFVEYQSSWKAMYEKANVLPVFLVTARTPEERVRMFDRENPAFLYAVSSEATTGGSLSSVSDVKDFLVRLKGLKLRNRIIVGFGISNRERFDAVVEDADGAIVGSSFIRAISNVNCSRESESQSDREALRQVIEAFVGEYTERRKQ